VCAMPVPEHRARPALPRARIFQPDGSRRRGGGARASARLARARRPAIHGRPENHPTNPHDPLTAGRLVDVVLKPSSVPHRDRPRCGGGHSSRAAVTGRLEQPTRGLERVTLHDVSSAVAQGPPHVRLCGLAPDGVCLAASVTGGAVGSYPAVSPWPAARSVAGAVRQVVSSLLHFPSRSHDRALPGIVLFGARTFLPPRFVPPIRLAAYRSDWFTTGDRLYGIDGEQGATGSLAPQWGGCVSWGG
jgi:hypothetical protein